MGSGDIDDHKELSARVFLQPFRSTGRENLRGIYLVGQGTWGRMSVPTERYETKGYRCADYESAIWCWRTEQIIGTDGRVTDRVSAEVGARRRLGAELHYIRGPLALSTELLTTRNSDVVLFHDFHVGSTREAHQSVHHYGDGSVNSWSTWASWYLTGESKRLTNQGWRTAKPSAPVGSGGAGAWEILARYSRALNPMTKIQLNNVFMWTPFGDRDEDGSNDNFLVSGALSGQADPGVRNRKARWENAVMLRLIFKI